MNLYELVWTRVCTYINPYELIWTSMNSYEWPTYFRSATETLNLRMFSSPAGTGRSSPTLPTSNPDIYQRYILIVIFVLLYLLYYIINCSIILLLLYNIIYEVYFEPRGGRWNLVTTNRPGSLIIAKMRTTGVGGNSL